MKSIFAVAILFMLVVTSLPFAQEVSFTQEDRERLIRLEVTLQEFKESTDKRFGQIMSFLGIITGIFTALTLGVIGFALWDRRTVVRKAKEETIEEIEKEGRLRDFINALRELAKTDPNLENVLKKFHLL